MLFKKRLKEKELIAALKEGREDALLQLYRDNYTSVRNYITRNNGTYDDAEDVLQDAVIVVWEKVKLNQLELHVKLSTFVFAVVKNKWLKQLRKNGRIDYVEEHFKSPSVEVNEEQMVDERVTLVKDMVEKLDDVCKKLLTYFYYHEMEMDKIAENMGFANANVAKSKKYQCFKKLQEQFLNQYKKSDFLD
jgi:RNA polymerase sigma factor (sigma-70 family)